jgi:hypothetical protein
MKRLLLTLMFVALSSSVQAGDTNVPIINAVSIPDNAHKVGDLVEVTITVNSDVDDYTTGSGAISGTINGYALASLSKIDNTTYKATFFISNGGTDVAAGSDIPVSLTVINSAGNPSAPYFTAINQPNDAIFANRPDVNLTASTLTIVEDGGTSTLSSALSGSLNNRWPEDVTVNLAHTGTAMIITDYDAASRITIPALATTGTTVITGLADMLIEPPIPETIVVDISSLSVGDEGPTNQQTLSIIDTDPPEMGFRNGFEIYNPPGSVWTGQDAAEANAWRFVAYGNGRFVAVALSGENRVMTSPDGISWTAHAAVEANMWASVAYGAGLFVAIAFTGEKQVMTSPDGINWTPRVAAKANQWSEITYGGGQFVAVAESGANRVMTSPDGINWTARQTSDDNIWNSVTYGGGQYVAVSRNGKNRVMTSPDGITWTASAAAEDNDWYSVTYGGGQFVAVADTGTNRVMSSANGIDWTAYEAAEANRWVGVTYGAGLFVAVAISGENRVMTSPDGISWTTYPAADDSVWVSVVYGAGQFVAVAREFKGILQVMTSPAE